MFIMLVFAPSWSVSRIFLRINNLRRVLRFQQKIKYILRSSLIESSFFVPIFSFLTFWLGRLGSSNLFGTLLTFILTNFLRQKVNTLNQNCSGWAWWRRIQISKTRFLRSYRIHNKLNHQQSHIGIRILYLIYFQLSEKYNKF